jgi:dipeptidyl aminopeptidase/acylaminoacyl peptidase
MNKNIYFFRGPSLWQAPVDRLGPREIWKAGDEDIGELLQLGNQGRSEFWSPDGGKSAVVLTRKYGFYQVDLNSGQTTKLLENDRAPECMCATVAQDGLIAYFASNAEHPSEIWVSAADFRHARQLTHRNSEFEKYQIGAARLIEWLSLDGDRLQGALLLPAGYQGGKRYPLVVYVYGGARLSSGVNSFGGGNTVINLQLLATRGYAVLLPDAPVHLGTPMLDLAKTVLPGIDRAIEMGIADPDRLGVMGHSNGGYSTLSLIVQTKRFKAAAMLSGFGDENGIYGEMSKESGNYGAFIAERQGMMGGTPWQYRERYIENSPIFYLDRVETPLLITHGSEDKTVAPFLADQVFVGLRRLGKEVEYANYEGAGHIPSTWGYANYVDFCERIISWFDRHLKVAPK